MKKQKDQTPRVFISSTEEDLDDYRRAAAEALAAAGCVPDRAEYWPASGHRPSMELCLNRAAEADALVVIVAHRYGWEPEDQPGNEDARKSITWLECEAADKAGKELLQFLVEAPNWPDAYREDFELRQRMLSGEATPELMIRSQRNIRRLQEFKEWLGPRGIRATVDSPRDLQHQIRLALVDWRKHHPELAGIVSDQLVDPGLYLQDLYDSTGHIDIRGLAVGSGKAHSFPIEELYVGLSVAGSAGDRRRLAEQTLHVPDPPLEDSTRSRPRKFESQPRLVVMGNPGAGKSTYLNWIAHTLAGDRLGLSDQAAKSRFGIAKPLIPVLTRVADWLEHIRTTKDRKDPSRPTTDSSAQWLYHYLGARAEAGNQGLTAAWFEERLKQGRCLILIDGLDETPDRQEREGMVTRIQEVSRAFRECPMVVTSRPVAYEGKAILSYFTSVSIETLDDTAIDSFLARWSRALFRNDRKKASALRDELLAAINSRQAIKRMARNMVMLTALAVVHWNENRLPEQRAELYESILTWLSRSREQRPSRERPERCLSILQELALAMQRDAEGRKVQVSRRWAAERIAEEFGDPTSRTTVEKAEVFLEAEELDSGILIRRGTELRFWHLTFQEYLAARATAARLDEEQKAILLGGDKAIYRTEWREVVQLLGGVLHARQGRGKVDGLFRVVLDDLYRSDKQALTDQAVTVGLLDGIVRDLGPYDFEPADPRYRETLRSIMRLFDASTGKKIALETRVEVADVLGRAGDPRLAPGNPDRWVPIPGGKLRMGMVANPREVEVAGFYIARWPITVEEYQRFVDADGYEDSQWWLLGGLGKFGTSPKEWEGQLEHPSRPVVYVSWYEAQAYCAWLTAELRRERRLGFQLEDMTSRLPRSAEWEWAAAGNSARPFPWGDQTPDENRANFGKLVNHPTPVGIFPIGSTPEGVLDMAGNVWEWCGDQESGSRVLRGGAFDYDDYCLNCAFRLYYDPKYRFNRLGFRAVLFPFL